jgi:hypothetical protein
MAPALSACSSAPPPDSTLSQLGARVGDAPQDDVDFPSLLRTYTTQAYAQQEEAFAKYKLFLAAKAADIALNRAEPDLVTFSKDVSGDEATVTLTIERKDGIFAVANAGVITVDLQKVDDEANPWRIEWIDFNP